MRERRFFVPVHYAAFWFRSQNYRIVVDILTSNRVTGDAACAVRISFLERGASQIIELLKRVKGKHLINSQLKGRLAAR